MGYPNSRKIYDDTGISSSIDVNIGLDGNKLNADNHTKFSMTIVVANGSALVGTVQMIGSNEFVNWESIGAAVGLPATSGAVTIRGDINESFIGVRLIITGGSADFKIYLTLK